MKKGQTRFTLLAGLTVLGGYALFAAQTKRVHARSVSEPSSSDKVIHYLRVKLNLLDTVNVALEPYRTSALKGFYDTTITVDDGKKAQDSKKMAMVSVSKDGRYVILSNAPYQPGASTSYALGADPRSDIVRIIRQVYRVPGPVTITASEFQISPFSDFLQTTIAASGSGKTQSLDAYLTKDRHFLILGSIYPLGIDPKQMILTVNQPSVGPRKAPVTIVEYADLECPSCARQHQFLEKELLPKYGDKVRVIFKEFPLEHIHEWALAGAIANQCAYQINPSAFVAYRSLIFEHQSEIDAVQSNPDTVREMLLKYGEQAGIDRIKLAECVDSKASLPRVRASLEEGNKLGVNQTPTFFINGQEVVGGLPPETLFRAIDEALRAAK